jgi:hypothetical protein
MDRSHPLGHLQEAGRGSLALVPRHDAVVPDGKNEAASPLS